MNKENNEGEQKIVYFSKNPTLSPNGLYVILAGETFPCADYRIFRTERSGIFWGGVYVIEYIISGRGFIESDGAVYEVSAGDTVFMNARKKIEYYSDPKCPYDKIWINFTGPFVRGIVEGIGLDRSVYITKFNAENSMLSIHKYLSKVNNDNMAYTFDKIAVELCGIFLKINNIEKSKEKLLDTLKLSTAEKIKNYIDSIVIPNVNLDDLSEKFSLEKGYIIHRFTDKFGISPYKYINQKKIEAAKNMLSDKNMKIIEISTALGYSGTQHFSSSFKKATGKTPKEYSST